MKNLGSVTILILAAVFVFVHPITWLGLKHKKFDSELDVEGDYWQDTSTTTPPSLSPAPVPGFELTYDLPASRLPSHTLPPPPSVVSTRPTRASFGEPCNKTTKCDSRGWLGCHGGQCSCIKQEEMVYDELLRKCVSKSGERCTFALDDIDDNKYIREITDCVAGAICSTDGICECGNRFYEDINGTCSKALSYLMNCESEAQCSRYEALSCQEGKCKCDESKAEYSFRKSQSQCVGLADSPCINSRCTAEATCDGNTCVCDPEFYGDNSGLCVIKKERLQNCTASIQCKQTESQKLVCLNGKCDCDPAISTFATARTARKNSDRNINNGQYWAQNSQFHEFIGDYKMQCVGLAGFPCIERLCGPNAYCAYPTNRYASDQGGTCKCMSSYTQSKSNTCASGYNSDCAVDSTCIDGLVCKNLKCRCPFDTQTFDESKKSCISQIGGPCSDNESCERNAVCQSKPAEPGHCVCKTGYVESMAGKCEADYDTGCVTTSNCDSVAGLQCVNKKCKCGRFAEFNRDSRKCVGLAGAKCNHSKQFECTKNAECVRMAPFLLPGSCQCSPGFKESADYKCESKGKDAMAEGTANEL